MKRIYILVVCTLFLMSCNSNEYSRKKQKSLENYYSHNFPNSKKLVCNQNFKSITTDKDLLKTISVEIDTDSKKTLHFFDYIDSVRFVALQTTSECLIGNINDILFASNRIFCLSNITQQKITIFDQFGKYINTINAVGKGPNEYTSINNVHIDYLQSNIVFFDCNLKKLFRYDFNGKHLSTEDASFYFGDFIFSKQSNYAFYSSDVENNMHIKPISNKRIICIKGNKEIMYSAIDLPKEYVNVHYTVFNFSYFNDEILYMPNFSDTIYSVDSSLISAKYYIKHKGNVLNTQVSQHTK